MKIETGKQYRMRYGGVTGAMRENPEHQYPFTDGRYRFAADGKFVVGCERHDLDLIAEAEVRDKLPFELRAGGKYVLDNGDVVTLEKSEYLQCLSAAFPFNVGGVNALAVNVAGEVYLVRSSTAFARITGEHTEPAPLERLQKWRGVSLDDELRSIIADLKAEAK